MSRVPMLEKAQALPEAQEIYNKIEQRGARVINLFKAEAHSPEVMLNAIRLGNVLLSKTELSPKLRELTILRVATLTGSQYEWAQHYRIALETGITQAQTEAVSDWSKSSLFSDEERAVLQYTDEVSQNVKVKDETFKTLQKFLNDRCIVELTLAIGNWGMIARFLVALEVDIDVAPVGSTSELMGRKK